MADPEQVVRTIIASQAGQLPADQTVSQAQLGALFAAMHIRRRFPVDTQWSDAETRAFANHSNDLAAFAYLLEGNTGIEPVDDVLAGRRLSRAVTADTLRSIADGRLPPALAAAFLIGQRMNIENDDELLGYVDVCNPEHAPTLNVDAVLHIGDPYDGMKRYFRPTLWVAATCAAMGHRLVLHGVASMPPKYGVTDQALLRTMDSGPARDIDHAATLVQDDDVGFAVVDQASFAPTAFSFAELRLHIKKRPAFATAEKTAVVFRGKQRTHMVAGFFHPGYERKLLVAMNDRGVDAGVAVKGLEGSTTLALRSRAGKQTFNRLVLEAADTHLDPRDLGFDYPDNPRLKADARTVADLGNAALLGAAGPARDAIVINAAWLASLLEPTTTTAQAVDRARDAIDSRAAARHLDAYIERC